MQRRCDAASRGAVTPDPKGRYPVLTGHRVGARNSLIGSVLSLAGHWVGAPCSNNACLEPKATESMGSSRYTGETRWAAAAAADRYKGE